MSKKNSRRRGASMKPVTSGKQARTPSPVSTLSYVVAGLGGAVIFMLLYNATAKIPLLLAPLVAGAFVAFVLESPVAAGIVGAAAGLVGAAIGATVSTQATWVALIQQAKTRWPDVETNVYAAASNLVKGNPVNSLGAAVVIVAGMLGTAAFAWGVAAALAQLKDRQMAARTSKILAIVIVVVLCLSFVYTAFSVSADFISGTASKPPQPGAYGYDAVIYLKTYYNMRDGQGYYDALMNAASGDARVTSEKTVRSGKYYPGGWIWGPAAIRRPTIFYVWKYLAPGGGGAVIGLGVWLSALVLGLSYWGLMPYLGKRSIVGPVVLMPYLLWMSFGFNPFFPDYWAALFVLASIALVLRKQWIAGAVVMFVAAITRETMGPLLGVFALALAVVWVRDRANRKWLVRAAVFAGLAVVWLVLERVHESIGAPYFAFQYTSSAQMLLNLAATRTFVQKVILPTDYMMFAYGFFYVYGLVWLVVAPLGFWAALTPEREVRFSMLVYCGFWALFLVTLGATSSYWGQTIMPVFLLGSAMLLACGDRLDRTLQMRTAIE